MSDLTELEARRALLVSRCELDRIEVAIAWLDVRRAVQLGPRSSDARPSWVGKALGYALPLVGAARARRMSRYLSLALLAYRILTALRAGAR
jgi:hypothetical protein